MVFAEKIVAWNVGTTRPSSWSTCPRMALVAARTVKGTRSVPGELIGHADAGSQYTSITFTDDPPTRAPALDRFEGRCYDNAPMECAIEPVQDRVAPHHDLHPGPTAPSATSSTTPPAGSIWYNNRCLHSSLGYVSPAEARGSPLRDPHREPMRAAENLARFTTPRPVDGSQRSAPAVLVSLGAWSQPDTDRSITRAQRQSRASVAALKAAKADVS